MKRRTINKLEQNRGQAVKGMVPYLLCLVYVLLSYVLLYNVALDAGGYHLKTVIFSTVAAIAIIILFLAYFNKLNYKKLIVLIIFIGIIMRVGYMLCTPYDTRQHDIFGDAGHLEYIYTIFSTWRLPTSNNQQFYHPPLFHFLGAVAYKIASIFYNNQEFAYNAVRLIPGLASCFTLIISYKIFKNLKFSNTAIIISTLIISINPAFIYLSASINNDMLAIFFMALTILYLVKWYYDQNFKNILIMAISLGLGMMTKLSAVMIAPVIAIVFIYVLIKRIKNRYLDDLLTQYFIFGAVSIPLGMWYSLRNLILFKQPIGYVNQISKYTDLYCGNYSITQRFLSLPLQNLFTNIFPDVTGDYNIYLYTLKSSLFGEWNFSDYETQAKLFMIANIILIAISLISMIYVILNAKDSEKRFSKWLLLLVWLIQVTSFIIFNINYPFGCTMDFRYIVITVLTGAGFIGLAYDVVKQKHEYLSKIVLIILVLSIILFGFNSIWFYTSI